MNTNWERAVLVSFLGNYIINTIIAGVIIGILPASTSKGITSPQYIVFALVSALFVAFLTWWYFGMTRGTMIKGITFGVIGFVVSVASTFVSGFAGVLVQTGSFSQAFGILPNFGPFLWNLATLVLLIVWIVPAALIGMYLEKPTSSM